MRPPWPSDTPTRRGDNGLRRFDRVDGGLSHLIITVKQARGSRRCVSVMSVTIRLSQARRGDRGVIVQVGGHCHHDEHALELERRLLELGFVEGARVELLHEGLLGRDPIAMKVDDMRVALRRHEAAGLTVRMEPAPAPVAVLAATEQVPA